MRSTVTAGVLVIGHGSRRPEANEDVREAARRVRKRGSFHLVEAAFLEIEHPNVGEGFARLVQQGAREITVHPYFLSPGRHTRGDIPVAIEAAARRHDGVTYRITEPLAAHRLVIEASVERIRETMDCENDQIPSARHYRTERGMVYLVGAGPGDPGLLTVRSLELLRRADVVIYDYLVNPEVLVYVPAGAERIYVGKIGGGRQTPQDEINRLLIGHAQNGKLVVRLKGGDPFLFGRGGEEAQALRLAGVSFEVVPGVSSALAVPAYAGIPLTHRHLSSSVSVVSAVQAGIGEVSTAIKNVANVDTIVVLMGVTFLRQVTDELIASGRSPDTPAAVIRWGTYEGQQTVTGSLRTISQEAQKAGLRAPAVIVIGEVVLLREQLQWFETKSTEFGNAENVTRTSLYLPV